MSSFQSMTVAQLKQYLKTHKQNQSGNKAELIKRAQATAELFSVTPYSSGPRPAEDCTESDSGITRKNNFVSTLKSWSDIDSVSSEDWPELSEKEVFNFLLYSKRKGAKKQIKAKNFYDCRHVHSIKYHHVDTDSTECHIKALVIPSAAPSDAKKLPDYNVWVELSKITAHITDGYCSCPAGVRSPPPPRIIVSGPSPEMERKRRRRRSSGSEDLQGRSTSDVFHLDSDSDSDSSDNALHMEQSSKSSVPLAYYTHELSVRGRLRRFFIRNSTTRVVYTFFDMILKSVMCAVYVARVVMDDLGSYECAGSPCYSTKVKNGTETNRPEGINWYPLLWVQRSTALWLVEVILAAVSFAKAILMVYISTKGHRMQQLMSLSFLQEILCAVPMLCTLAYPPLLKDMFVPMFLNCKLAQRSLQKIYNDLHLTRQKFQTISVTLLQQMIILMTNIIVLGFITICMIQHLQRASPELKLTMFDSLYFVVVTFSTVGYGDISPDIWLSRLYMLIIICVAFASLPRQIEGLISTYLERKKAGGEYSRHAARRYRHVIVCTSSLSQDTVIDFLNEFYAHPKLEDHTVIVLCPQELDSSSQVILKDPKWAHRVIYMRGSSLKDIDLTRCHIHEADACFFLAQRPTSDKVKADRHTILRSWAVKDFAPSCKQYIQLFSAANKIHVKFAEHVVCEDEFKYALLANNCLYPGLSTLVSMLVHTSFGHEGVLAPEPWQQVYGRHSGNEIYHIQLHKSVFFSQYAGETFPVASADAHRRFGVALLAVLDPDVESPHLQLNPGPLYKLKGTDFCFYMSVTREEYSEIKPEALTNVRRRPSESVAQIALALQKYHLEPDPLANAEDPDESVFNTITSLMGNNITRMVHSNSSLHHDGTEESATAATSPTTPLMTESNDTFNFTGATTATTTPIASNGNHTPGAPASGDSTDNNAAESSGERLGKKKKFIVTPAPSTASSVASRVVNSNSNKNQQRGSASSRPLLKSNSEDASMSTYGDKIDSCTQGGEERFGVNQRSTSIDSLDNVDHRHRTGRVLQYWQDMEQDKLTTGPPPVTIYSGSRRTTCHIMTEPRNICCLEWGRDCSHCTYKNAKDERWGHQLIILAAEHASTGIFNFIVPLRSAFIGIHGLSPIVLLLEEEPDSLFLDTIAQFPLVYYMIGSIRNVDDLLISGINKASHLVVVNRDSEACHGGEEILADSETIVAVQTIFRLFPNTYVVTELGQTSNMRFMQFTAQEAFALKTSKLEQRLRDSVATNLNHIFRLPFAAGQVFSARMLDTLLYQTFVKGYLISFVRLLLGIDAEEGSGHLSSIRVKRATLQKFPEYGELYEGLCTATGEIPFAIYRTERIDRGSESPETEDVASEDHQQNNKYQKNPSTLNNGHKSHFKSRRTRFSQRFSNLTRQDHGDLGSMIRNRLSSLDLSLSDYSDVRRKPDTLSYIITNPSPKLKLRIGDIVYVIQPSSMYAKPSKHKFFMRRAHSLSDDKLSTPPPSYQHLARQRAHSNVESCKNFTSRHPWIPANTTSAAANTQGSGNSIPLEMRSPRGVSFNTEPDRTTGAVMNHIPEESLSPSSLHEERHPLNSADYSHQANPLSPKISDAVDKISDPQPQHLLTNGLKNSPADNIGDLGKDENIRVDFTPDAEGEGIRKNTQGGLEENGAGELDSLTSEKALPHSKSFVVNVDNGDLLGVGSNNRI